MKGLRKSWRESHPVGQCHVTRTPAFDANHPSRLSSQPQPLSIILRTGHLCDLSRHYLYYIGSSLT
jgi:hypothetical protein